MRPVTISLAFLTVLSTGGPAMAQLTMNTTVNNFHTRGTQPNMLTTQILRATECVGCHGAQPATIYEAWAGSIMAQAARDPVFYACLDIAENDAPGIGQTCIRCHAPKAFLEGRSIPTNGSALTVDDRDSVTCNFCHRLVDPFGKPGAPPVDPPILAALGPNAPIQSYDLGNPPLPGDNANGGYVVDPIDQRRGPFPVAPPGVTPVWPEVDCSFFHGFGLGPETFESPLHRRSDLCATCHDVSPPHFTLNAQGTAYVFNGTDNRHPTGNKYEMVPEQRTYSEWLNSSFANGGVYIGQRFGGNINGLITDCQDCHMPKVTDTMCNFVLGTRDDVGQHYFSGAATWVLDAIKRYWGQSGPMPELQFSEEQAIEDNIVRNRKMLECAVDLDVFLDDSQTPGVDRLLVRVINQTGHKLPTGYPEGRRMFLTVQYFNCLSSETPFVEFGGYDPVENQLDEATTTVYEVKPGTDNALAASLNRTPGPSFHVAFANKIFKDNRIPPRGFTNANFAAINAAPIGHNYADGQYWDDTFFDIPPYAVNVRVILSYESSTRDYIEFLYDNNPFFGTPGNRGEILYNLWDNSGNRPQPEIMAVFPPVVAIDDGEPPCTLPTIDLTVFDPDGDGLFDVELAGDVNGDRQVTPADIPEFVAVLLGASTDPLRICAADMDHSGAADGRDIDALVAALVMP